MTMLTVLVLCIGSDQILKQVAKVLLRYSPPIPYLNDIVRLQYVENKGIMLSIGSGLSDEMRFWIFTVAVGVVLIVMLVHVVWSRDMDRMQTIAWSLVLSGGFGNLIDRFMRNGVVIDFISVGVGSVRTAIFNLADVLVFAGVFLLLIHGRKERRTAEVNSPIETKEESSD